jgi:hypothetical protein
MPPLGFLTFVLLLLPISVMLVVRNRKKIRLELIGLYVFFLLQGLTSSRHIPLWTIVTLPILSEALLLLYLEVKTIKFGEERFLKLFKFITIGVILMFVSQSVYSSFAKSYVSEDTFYPKKAVSYLMDNLPENQIFSDYGWGGYLIWKLPQKKVFIDGRMPSWRWDYKGDNESSYAMEDYLNILSGEVGYKDIFQKYQITVVLMPVQRQETPISKLDKKFKKLLGKIFKNKKNVDFNLIQELEKDGWIKVYSDDTAVIYEKN